jgi:hypothetical protein
MTVTLTRDTQGVTPRLYQYIPVRNSIYRPQRDKNEHRKISSESSHPDSEFGHLDGADGIGIRMGRMSRPPFL